MAPRTPLFALTAFPVRVASAECFPPILASWGIPGDSNRSLANCGPRLLASESGEGSRGAEPASYAGVVEPEGFFAYGVRVRILEGRAPRVCTQSPHPPPHRGSRGGQRKRGIWRWAPGPTRHPVVLRELPPDGVRPASTPAPPRRVHAARRARGALVLSVCEVASLPHAAAFPRSGNSGDLPSPLLGAGNPGLAGLISPSGSVAFFKGERRLAASGASSDVGARSRSEGLWRWWRRLAVFPC